jgi:N-acylglucosamine-6-phosphate 2-epimerase
MTNLMQRGIIVSCQALTDEPLHGGDTMLKMAMAAQLGGAIGIRANGVNDIVGIKNVIDLPLIGLYKHTIPGSSIFITPTINEVKAVVDAGADIVAMDVTNREGRYEQVRELLDYVHGAGRLAMADISTYEEGIQAEQMGFEYVSTTLSGYTPYSPQQDGPDFELVRQLSKVLGVPVVMEGRVWRPEEAIQGLEAGAQYVVVGSAITRPMLITSRYTSLADNWLKGQQQYME